MSRKILGPFNRVEGDLAVNLTLENGRVAQGRSPARYIAALSARWLAGRWPMHWWWFRAFAAFARCRNRWRRCG